MTTVSAPFACWVHRKSHHVPIVDTPIATNVCRGGVASAPSAQCAPGGSPVSLFSLQKNKRNIKPFESIAQTFSSMITRPRLKSISMPSPDGSVVWWTFSKARVYSLSIYGASLISSCVSPNCVITGRKHFAHYPHCIYIYFRKKYMTATNIEYKINWNWFHYFYVI